MLPEPVIMMPGFVARYEGFDLRTLDRADEEAMRATMARYPVIILADQHLAPDDQIAFAQRFGTIDNTHKLSSHKSGANELLEISNVDAALNILPVTDKRRSIDLANRLWHSDLSFQTIPAHHSMLYAIRVTSKGGETQFADLRAAYDALSDDWRTEIEDLIVHHSLLHSRQLMGFTEWTAEERAKLEGGAAHPLVRSLPDSGRRTLYLSSHASHIVGAPVPEGRMLLHDLTDLATQPANVYTHAWQAGDFVIWDNRCTMHRLRRYDSLGERRVLRRVSTVDTAYGSPASARTLDMVN